MEQRSLENRAGHFAMAGSPLSCPGCGVVVGPSAKQEALVGYHHCRGCGFVWREQSAKPPQEGTAAPD